MTAEGEGSTQRQTENGKATFLVSTVLESI